MTEDFDILVFEKSRQNSKYTEIPRSMGTISQNEIFFVYERQVFRSGSQYCNIHQRHCYFDFRFERFSQISRGDGIRGDTGSVV